MSDARPELIRALGAFCEPPTSRLEPVVEALRLGSVPGRDEFTECFVLNAYPYASVYLGPEGQMGGEARSRIAGFWDALGLPVPAEPDHLTALLGLWASLLDRSREQQGQNEARAKLLGQAARTCVREHLAPWVFAFTAAVRRCGSSAYTAWAELLDRTLGAAIEGGQPLPCALREALPGLTRGDVGGSEVLTALLTPVRSGIVLLRTDLVAVGRRLNLATRVSERRYALEALLSQAPTETAQALAEHAAGWIAIGGAHPDPEIGAFWRERASGTAALMSETAEAVDGAERWSAP